MLAAAVLASLLAQDPTAQLRRTFGIGELPALAATVTVHLSSGQLETKCSLRRRVRETRPDGSAWLDFQVTDMKSYFNGEETPNRLSPNQNENAWSCLLGPNGIPLPDSKSPRGILILEILNAGLLGSILPPSEAKVGSTYKASFAEKSGAKWEADYTLAEVKEGKIRITSTAVLTRAPSGQKMPLKMTTWVETSTGDVLKVEGVSDQPPNTPAGVGVSRIAFALERAR